jgi:hypothetical protein
VSALVKTEATAGEVAALVSELAGGLKHEAGCPTLMRLPDDGERVTLQARQIALNTALRSISYSAHDKKPTQLAGAAIAEMLHGFEAWKAKSRAVDQDKQDSIGWYVHELRDMPLFAIEAACQDVRQNRVPDLKPDFPPSSARMVALARGYAEAARKEHGLVKVLLSVTTARGPELSMDRSVRVGEGLRSLADGFMANLEKQERERNEALSAKTIERNRKDILHEHQVLGVPPIMATKDMPISIALRRNIAEYKENEARERGGRREDKNRDQGS